MIRNALLCSAVLLPALSAHADERSIGYPTAAAAFEALQSRTDVKTSLQDGWTVVQDDSKRTLWSFTPPGHPAHPAVVKRTLVNKETGAAIELKALCQAEKAVCDKLVEDFRALDKKVGQSAREKSPPPGEPRDATATGVNAKGFNPNIYVTDGGARDYAVETQTLAYFALRDEKKYKDAYALHSELRQQSTSLEKWSAAVDRFNTQAGEIVSRKIKKITWYKNPPGNLPGSYATVDFISEFANMPFHCGYLVWRQDADSYRLVREEENMIDAATQKKLSPADLLNLRKKYGC